jgi:hypothetical protein
MAAKTEGFLKHNLEEIFYIIADKTERKLDLQHLQKREMQPGGGSETKSVSRRAGRPKNLKGQNQEERNPGDEN